MKRAMTIVAVIFVLALVGWQIFSGPEREAERSAFQMDTYIEAKIYGPRPEVALDAAFNRLVEVENKFSVTIPTSTISQINQAAGENAITIDDEVLYVMERALHFAALSNGAFDPSIYPLIRLWGIGTERQRVPSQFEIDAILDLVNHENIELDIEQRSVFLQEGMSLDLGGIAKGYGADAMAQVLREHNIGSALLYLGGDLYAIGNRPDGNPWRIGIRDPYGPEASYLGIAEISDVAIVSSGDYQRYFEEGGIRYHHIFDLQTGYPAVSDTVATTVVAPNATDADALSTLIFILGSEKGLEFIEALPEVEAIFVTRDHKVKISSGMKELFRLTNVEGYELVYEDR